jgi:hypothetical protein
MSGARVALGSIPGKGIAVDGVVAVLPRDSIILRANVAAGKSVLKGQAVVFSPGALNTVECSAAQDMDFTSVGNTARVFAGLAESSGTKDLVSYKTEIGVISVLRGPVGRGVFGTPVAPAPAAGTLGASLINNANARYAVAGVDGMIFEGTKANHHARIRSIEVVGSAYAGGGTFPQGEPFAPISAVDLEFNTIGH